MPQGRLLATGQAGADSDVVVWEAETGKVVYRFEEHDHGVADVAISDDEVRDASKPPLGPMAWFSIIRSWLRGAVCPRGAPQ